MREKNTTRAIVGRARTGAWLMLAGVAAAVVLAIIAIPTASRSPSTAVDVPVATASMLPVTTGLPPWPLYLSGRVLDPSGRPVPDWPIWQGRMRSPMGDPNVPTSFTDVHGAFRFIAISRAPHWLATYDPREPSHWIPSASVADISPGGPDLTLQLTECSYATCFVSGRIASNAGGGTPSCDVRIETRDSASAPATFERSTGEFKCGPIPALEYRVIVTSMRFATWRSAWQSLNPNSTWRLDDIELVPNGALSITPLGREPRGEPRFTLSQSGVTLPHHTFPDRARAARTKRTTYESKSLEPGDYVLEWSGTDLVAGSMHFEIESGETTHLDVPLRRVDGLYLGVVIPAPTVSQTGAIVQTRDIASGRTTTTAHWIPQDERTFYVRFDRPKSPLNVVVTTDSGLRGGLDLEPVSESGDVDVTLRLR